MASRSYSARELQAIEDRINSDPEELAHFAKSPADYLHRAGIELSDDHKKELAAAVHQMQIGPNNLSQMTAISKPKVGIGISIRIRF